jgi:hypothetical protein
MQIKAKKDLAQSELDRLGQQVRADFTKRGEHPTCDGLVADVKAMASETDLAVKRVMSQLDDLAGFLKQNDDYASKLDFPSVRTWIDDLRKKATELGSRISAIAGELKDIRMNVSAGSGDWESTKLTAASGDMLALEATGAWSVGAWAGSCGPGGMAGYANYSLVADKPHGCLLVRAGDTMISAAKASGIFQIPAPGGSVTMRCNDKKATDNSGTLAVRIVLVPFGAHRPQ